MTRWTANELNLEKATKIEWLETNGLGGYASGTVSGIRSRRYHGYLIASLRPPTQRTLLFAGIDERLSDGRCAYHLTAHLFRDGTVTQWTAPTEFLVDWCPSWRYELQGVSVAKRVFMPHMRNAVVIRYFVSPQTPVELSVRLFVAYRDHHWTMKPAISFTMKCLEQRLTVYPGPDSPPILHITHNGDFFVAEQNWWHDFWLSVETERGLDDTESLFCLGAIVKRFDGEGHLDIIASVEPCDKGEVAELECEERKRRERIVSKACGNELLAVLLKASGDFVALRSSTGTRTIIAGYPWFTDWGRDALIALPGLTLVTGRFSVAREILLTFSRYLSEGMVPNFFPESGETPAYNTVDATLWFVLAVYRYLRYARDETILHRLWEPLREIFLRHLNGTRYKICVDRKDGLLAWGHESLNEALTWMDAKVWGKPVTPRVGKPVEVNALWCNVLEITSRFAKQVGDKCVEKSAAQLAETATFNFERTFWSEERGCLFDLVALDGTPDPSVRCNQILALALPFRLLSPEKERSVLKVVETELLTPFGLRTLSPNSPNYIGRYLGPPHERDAAYHQGTVWAWWFGPYADAVSLVEGKKTVQRKVRPLLENFLKRHLKDSCVGQVSEIFDGDEPHTPRGCFVQAWSVAEVLRAWVERVEGKLPSPLWNER